nr:uncharacterized protein CI109_002840 [Kwoniella shandongensis]KAA5528682.1 hypothetical protein CI109_002840 [Kwoniella shandongensis]
MGILDRLGSSSGLGRGDGDEGEHNEDRPRKLTWKQKGKWKAKNQEVPDEEEVPATPREGSRTPSPPTPESIVAPHLNFKRKDRSIQTMSSNQEGTPVVGGAKLESSGAPMVRSSPPQSRPPPVSILTPTKTAKTIQHPPATRMPSTDSRFLDIPLGDTSPSTGQFPLLLPSAMEPASRFGFSIHLELARDRLLRLLHEQRVQNATRSEPDSTTLPTGDNTVETDWKTDGSSRSRVAHTKTVPKSVRFSDQTHPERTPSILRPHREAKASSRVELSPFELQLPSTIPPAPERTWG